MHDNIIAICSDGGRPCQHHRGGGRGWQRHTRLRRVCRHDDGIERGQEQKNICGDKKRIQGEQE